MKCLFIGGDFDGQRLVVDSSLQEIRLATLARPPKHRLVRAEEIAEVKVFQSYKRIDLIDSDGQSHVIYINGGDVNAPIRRLIDAYVGENETH